MADSTASKVCALCAGPLVGRDHDRDTCHDCRSPNEKIAELDIAVRTSGDDPEHISSWPQIRHFLRKRFGENRSIGELWERCRDWLSAEVGLAPNDYMALPLSTLVRIVSDAYGVTSRSEWMQHWKRYEQNCVAAALLPPGVEKSRAFDLCRIEFAELKASSFASKEQAYSEREGLLSKIVVFYLNDCYQLDKDELRRLDDWLKAPEPKPPFPNTMNKNLARLATYWALRPPEDISGNIAAAAGDKSPGESNQSSDRGDQSPAMSGGMPNPEMVDAEITSRPAIAALLTVPRGLMGDVELAAALNVHTSQIPAFRAKLRRMRDNGELSIDDWQEFENRKRHEPKYLYRANSPTIVTMARRYVPPK